MSFRLKIHSQRRLTRSLIGCALLAQGALQTVMANEAVPSQPTAQVVTMPVTVDLFWQAVSSGQVDKVEEYIAQNGRLDMVNRFGQTPIHVALERRNAALFETLVKAGAPLDQPDAQGLTPLMQAVNDQRIQWVERLIQAGAKVNAQDDKGWAALHYTVNQPGGAARDLHEIARLLIESGADMNLQTQSGHTPINLAASNLKPKTLRLLLSRGANPNMANNEGVTPLMYVVNDDHYDLVISLLSAGADPNSANQLGWTALHYTANKNAYIEYDVKRTLENDLAETANLLLDAGAKVDSVNQDGLTPLSIAAWRNKPRLVSLLLKSGANPNQADKDGVTPLMYAVHSGNLKNVNLILATGADLSLQDRNGLTALHYAVNAKPFVDQPKILAALLAAQANLNLVTAQGLTPLALAVMNGADGLIEALLQGGADANLPDIKGWTPLMHAVSQNNLNLMQLLLSHGAKVDYRGGEQAWSALHLTVSRDRRKQNDFADAAQLLIHAGANIEISNAQGLTPLMLASYNNALKTAEVLLKSGATQKARNTDVSAKLLAQYRRHEKMQALLAAY